MSAPYSPATKLDLYAFSVQQFYGDTNEATVLHLESQAFEDFIQALDQPVPPAAEKLMERDPQWA